MKGERVTLNITGSGMNGEGVARLDGLTVFVGGALIGETVEAILYERKKNFARARIIKIIAAAPERVEPICPVYYRCGGCSLQHIEYSAGLALKRAELMSCLKKQFKRDIAVDEVVPSDKVFGYRNKLQLPIGEQGGRIVGGFYKENSHDIVSIDSCPLHGEWADIIIRIVIGFANDYKLTAFNEATGKGLLRHLIVRRVGAAQYSIVLVINGDALPSSDILAEHLKAELQDRFTLHYSINSERNNVIMGESLYAIVGGDVINTEISGLSVGVSPLSFMQVNDYIRDLIYADVVERLNVEDIVIDVYSGAGVMTALAAKKARAAIGIEIVNAAIADANALMSANGLGDRAVNICGDASAVLPRLTSYFALYGFDSDRLRSDIASGVFSSNTSTPMPTVSAAYSDSSASDSSNNLAIILDPPRKGCTSEVINAILAASPSKLLYISCNPATLARDLAALTALDRYAITSVTPYDMFSETSHIETLVCLEKKRC